MTQDVHPSPVDTPALGWLSRGHDVLPAEFGYFLAQSRRMDRAMARPISHLAYAGALAAHACTEARVLEGAAPGVVAIVTPAASSVLDALRGMKLLVNRNRLNVAVPRAKWAARSVYSPRLPGHLPGTPER